MRVKQYKWIPANSVQPGFVQLCSFQRIANYSICSTCSTPAEYLLSLQLHARGSQLFLAFLRFSSESVSDSRNVWSERAQIDVL
jgi:hypothetical protein